MVQGSPQDGVLPSGQVAGLIDDLPSCTELIERIVSEAELSLLNIGAITRGETEHAI
jgi:NAD(P)H-dependent flavin oxidoreductase YrpB (nitropropane dioxygenase family)